MSHTYYGTRNLIALPGRSVQTFPSGLVRVERSFACRPEDAARYRNTLRVNEPMPFDDGAPAINGLFIFPEPQERLRDDGFVEFRVTAYGLSNTVGQQEKRLEAGTYTSTQIANGQTSAGQVPCFNEIAIIRQVVSANTYPSFSVPPIELKTFLSINGELQDIRSAIPSSRTFDSQSVQSTQTFTRVVLKSYDSINFGRWDELTLIYEAQSSATSNFVNLN
jgi:hypothetical protein